MRSRLELHNDLLTYIPRVYFQPPSNIQMSYPCIVYNKVASQSYGDDSSKKRANNKVYSKLQEYNVMVIERDPDSVLPDRMEEEFEYCSISQRYTIDNLHHATLSLYY